MRGVRTVDSCACPRKVVGNGYRQAVRSNLMVHHDALVCMDHGDDVPCDWVVLHQLRHLVAGVEGDGCAYHQGVVLLSWCVVVHNITIHYHTIQYQYLSIGY